LSPFFLHYISISTYGLQALRYSITSSSTKLPNGNLQKSPNDFSKSPTTISPIKFSPNLLNCQTVFLQNHQIISPKSPTMILLNKFSPKRRQIFCQKSPNKISPNHQTSLLQVANVSRHMFSPNRRTVCRKPPRYFADQWAAYFLFCSLRRKPSLRSLPTRAMGSALCVMGGRLWFLGYAHFSYTCTGSALDVMDYGLSKAESSEQNLLLGHHSYCLYLQVSSTTAKQHTFRVVFYGEEPVTDLSLHVPRAPHSVLWVSAAVPGSRLLLLHVHGLRARRYGLWANQGRELNSELIARTPLIVCTSPSYFDNRRAAHVLLFFLWRRPSF